MRIVHLSPLPGDVAIACPATLRGLAKADHEVLDVCPKRNPGHEAACRALGARSIEMDLEKFLKTEAWDLLLAPGTQSINRAHEEAGRLARSYTKDSVWWSWSIETTLRLPNLHFPFGIEEMNSLQENLHHLEDRQRMARLLRGRAEMIGALWGKARFAEALDESIQMNGSWKKGSVRTIDPKEPFLYKK